jgi:hypothetical protein
MGLTFEKSIKYNIYNILKFIYEHKSTLNNNTNILLLPEEILEHILSFTNCTSDLYNFYHAGNLFAHNNGYDRIWHRICAHPINIKQSLYTNPYGFFLKIINENVKNLPNHLTHIVLVFESCSLSDNAHNTLPKVCEMLEHVEKFIVELPISVTHIKMEEIHYIFLKKHIDDLPNLQKLILHHQHMSGLLKIDNILYTCRIPLGQHGQKGSTGSKNDDIKLCKKEIYQCRSQIGKLLDDPSSFIRYPCRSYVSDKFEIELWHEDLDDLVQNEIKRLKEKILCFKKWLHKLR